MLKKVSETPFWTPGRVFMMFLTLFGRPFLAIFTVFYGDFVTMGNDESHQKWPRGAEKTCLGPFFRCF